MIERIPPAPPGSSPRTRWLSGLLAPCLALLSAGCESTPDRPDVERLTIEAPEVEPIVSLGPGTTIHLRSTRAVSEGLLDALVVDGLLREALRQSPVFDIAAGAESAERHDATIEVVLDSFAGRIECALLEGDQRVPLAGVGADQRSLNESIDRLAWTLRLALGEDVRDTPRPISVIYSQSAKCVRHCERAMADQARGWRDLGEEESAKAIREDPGCTIAILLSIQAQLARGEIEEASDRSRRTLQLLERRCSLTTQHRLARTNLTAGSATNDPVRAREFDDRLVELGNAYLEERPHDPDGLMTRATGLLNRGDFAASVTDLRRLRKRWPQNSFVGLKLALAELGVGRAEAALDAIDSVERALPDGVALVPKAMALHRTGALDELDHLLERRLRRTSETSADRLTLLQYRAATAVLRGAESEAIGYCLAIVRFLRERPSISSRRIEPLRDAGETLVELGASDRLRPELQAMLAQGPKPELELVIELLLALANSSSSDLIPIVAERFEQSGKPGYAATVRAMGARTTSDLTREGEQWTLALALDDRALTRARLIRTLTQMGADQQALTLREDTRERLLRFEIRGPYQTPITSPGRALAWLAVR